VQAADISAEVGSALLSSSLLLSAVKTASRKTLLTLEAAREAVIVENSKTDSHHLSLQNLLYERAHLLREIARCREYETPEVNKVVGSSITLGGPDAHDRMLARLHEERRERLELQSLLEQKKSVLAKLRDENAAKQKLLSAVPSQLDDILKATVPLQKSVGSDVGAQFPSHDEYKGLPAPLQALFSLLAAFQERETQRSTSAEGVHVASSMSGVLVAPSVKEVPEGTDTPSFSVRTRSTAPAQQPVTGYKRARTDVNIGASAPLDSFVDVSDAVTPHPLALIWLIAASRQANKTFSALRFQYLPALDVVTVAPDTEVSVDVARAVLQGATSGSCTLTTLDSAVLDTFVHGLDTSESKRVSGDRTPHAWVVATSSSVDALSQQQSFPQWVRGTPYGWLQRLCGLSEPTSPLPSVAALAAFLREVTASDRSFA
jgi:THO complex subunit 5